MAQLHELLAVESDLRTAAAQELSRVRGMFEAPTAFVGQTRMYRPLLEGGEPLPAENTPLGSHVTDELTSLFVKFGEWVEAVVQKEMTNTMTSASVVVDGVILAEDLPAPALLNLESRLAELRQVIQSIPTLTPSEEWTWDENAGVYVSAPRITYRTKKVPRTLVAYEATKEHPAQVQVFQEDIREGEWTTTIFCATMTVAAKNAMLDRLDKVLRAVKKARQKANTADIAEVSVSGLFDYIRRTS